MTRYILKRTGQVIIGLFAMSIIIFLLARLTGDPALVILPQHVSPEQREELRHHLRLDEPYHVQYGIWLWNAFQGDLGESHSRNEKVIDMLLERVPATLQLAVVAFAISLLIGMPIGIYAAAWRGGPFDLSARLFAVLGQAMPPFWLGLIFMMIFGVWLRVLPVAGKSSLDSLIMPALTLGWFTTAGIMRLTRSSMLEIIDSEYIKLARIKGVGESQILWKHAFKNASLPVLTYAGLVFLFLVSGTIIVESIFAWPGVGLLILQATQARDFPIVQGAAMFITGLFLVGNLFLDVMYAYFNPRIRFD